MEERSIAASIPRLTQIDSKSSRAGDSESSQSAHPRWVWAAAPLQSLGITMSGPLNAVDVLVAGCGTGLSAIELATRGNARVLAVDLNLTSLSYGKRMAQNLGLTNVEFVQADIMKCDALGRQFDFIDVSGVLDHLTDPWEGWRILLSLLRAGGTMQVGVYSAMARRKIAAARALIAERGYQASDICRCREGLAGRHHSLAGS